MTKYLLILGGLICSFGCTKKEFPLITVIDIGHLDRKGIAKELRTINQHSPRIVGLVFRLEADSLDKDTELAEEFSKTKNLVQASHLLFSTSNFDSYTEDSLGTNHPKLIFGDHGFINLETIKDDSIISRKLKMRQKLGSQTEYAFSYLVASKYNPQKTSLKYKNTDTPYTFDKNSFGRFFKVISASDLLNGNFSKADLSDKIVLMGYVGDIGDYLLDENRHNSISGVEVQACFIKAILN